MQLLDPLYGSVRLGAKDPPLGAVTRWPIRGGHSQPVTGEYRAHAVSRVATWSLPFV